ncbi:TetR/AcrR family transcriptional regulator [Occultella aeris]|uniref:Putative HTH-type transcriptional regulator YfiR n=1 Tax=Occultella aeris TaxID=2761496 RepID=A0A7M4DE28_9MICO|nr:TetR/AcrR family transcriptional regulator [Occultella aeris]VZO35142.1 putative HTH-type transcriptional regulator YfiR [Occultella aeris]
MPRITQARREARRDQIRAAALRAFAAKGYQRTSIADVVSESGLSAGAIYGHYADKGELFGAVAQHVLSRRDDEIAAASHEGVPPSPYEILVLLTGGMARDLSDGRVLVQLWSESTVDPALHAVVQRVVGSVRGVLGDALRNWFATRPDLAPDGPDAAAHLLLPVVMGLGQSFIMQRALLEDFDPDAYLAAAEAILPR